jgi:hypothetical protein
MAASTRRGTRPSRPSRLSLDQRELDRHLLDRLGQPSDLGLGRLEFVVPLHRLHAGFGRGERGQRTLLGHGAYPHDRRSVDLLLLGGLGDRHLLPDDLQPNLVLLRGRQEPLGAPAGTVLATVGFGHHRILRDGSKEPSDVG